jgi:hypothetical protein
MIPLNVFKVGISIMTVVANRPVHHAKTITVRPMALNAIDIVMELLPINLHVPHQISMIPLNVLQLVVLTGTVALGRPYHHAKMVT